MNRKNKDWAAAGVKNWLVVVFIMVSMAAGISAARAGDGVERLLSFDVSEISEVKIEMSEADWARICRQTRNIGAAFGGAAKYGEFNKPFSYFKADIIINGERIEGVGVRKKGFIGSLDNYRPSLKVKLNFTDPDFHIGGVTHLTLNNCKQDGPLINQYMTYNLYSRVGAPAPRASFAALEVNGEKLGVYSHVESMRKPMIEREFGSDKGNLYEGTLVDFYPGWEKGFERKFGEKKRGEAVISKLIEVLNSELEGEELVAEVSKLVDMDNFYNYWVIEGLIGFWDGYSGNKNNFFFHISHEDGKLRFMPWGADSVFSNNRGFGRGGGSKVVKTGGILAGRLYSVESVRQRYQDTVFEVMEKGWDADWMIAEAKRLEEMLKPHIHDSQFRYSEALASMRSFIENRKFEVLDEVLEGMPEIPFSPSPPRYSEIAGTLETSLVIPILNEKPGDSEGIGKVDPKLAYGENELNPIGFGVYAAPYDASSGGGGFRGFGRGRGPDPDQMLTVTIDLFLGEAPDQVSVTFNLDKAELVDPDNSPITAQGSVSIGNEFSTVQESNSLDATFKIQSVEEMDGRKVIHGSLNARFFQNNRFRRF